MILEATNRVAGSSLNVRFNFAQTVSRASDICRINSGSKAHEWRDWSSTKDRIGQQLKAHYQACTTEELPPRLLALVKRLDEEILKKQEAPLP
jgi:hypothetical protein